MIDEVNDMAEFKVGDNCIYTDHFGTKIDCVILSTNDERSHIYIRAEDDRLITNNSNLKKIEPKIEQKTVNGFTDFTPKTEREFELVGALLAKMRGNAGIQWLDGGEWDLCNNNKYLHIERAYGLGQKAEPESTPLDIPWGLIDKKYIFAAMDEDCGKWVYEEKPNKESNFWECELGNERIDAIKINTDGIIWDKSLTVRPDNC